MKLKQVISVLSVLFLSAAAGTQAAQTRVLFISNPPGATVVDVTLGELGATPFRMNIKRGTELECTFSKEGFESRSVTQTIEGLKADVRADLPALPLTTVRLGVDPWNTSVRLTGPDGTEIYSGEGGRVHTLANDLWGAEATATFKVEASAPGYRAVEREIELDKHESHALEFPLTEVSTLLSITAEPESVRVRDTYLGDLGWTPLEARVSLVELMRARSRKGAASGDPAKLMLTLSREGFETRALPVALDFDRAENSVNVALEADRPAGAR